MPILHMQTDQVRNSARQIQRSADEAGGITTQLQQSLHRLHGSWSGSSADRFANDMNYVLRSIQGVADDGIQLSQRVLAEVDEWETVDNSWSTVIPPPDLRFYNLPAAGAAVGTIGVSGWIYSDDGGGAYKKDGFLAEWIETGGDSSIEKQFILLEGQKIDLYEQYREGEMTFEEMIANINEMEEDAAKAMGPDYFHAKATIYEARAEAGDALWRDSISGKYGTVDASVMHTEGSLAAYLDFDLEEGQFGLGTEAEIAAYAAQIGYGYENAGLDVAAQAFVGGEAQGELGVNFDPFAGTAMAAVGAGAFIGGKAQGSLSYDLFDEDVASIGASGAVSYGLGATAQGELGFDEGVFKIDTDLGLTIGLGVEFGIDFELNVVEAGKDIANMGQSAIDIIF